jgi:hypothetical protein
MSKYNNFIGDLLKLVKSDVNYIWLPTKTITKRYASYLHNTQVKRAFLLALNKDRLHVKLFKELVYDTFLERKYPEWDSEVEMLSQTDDFVTYKCKLTKVRCSPRQFIVVVHPKENSVQIAKLQSTIKSYKQ